MFLSTYDFSVNIQYPFWKCSSHHHTVYLYFCIKTACPANKVGYYTLKETYDNIKRAYYKQETALNDGHFLKIPRWRIFLFLS